MKPIVAVALIVCGTAVVAILPAQDYLMAFDAAWVMTSRPDLREYTTTGVPMPGPYRYACLASGLAMIAVAVVGSFRGGAGRADHAMGWDADRI